MQAGCVAEEVAAILSVPENRLANPDPGIRGCWECLTAKTGSSQKTS